jgi:hypothetical protein
MPVRRQMEVVMKRVVLCLTMLMIIIGTAGCSRKEVIITVDDVSVNTLLAKANGELNVAMVEEFDKSYYDISEMEEFAANKIKEYNQKAGGDHIALMQSANRDGKAILLLSYSGMDQYAAFNQVTAAYFNGGVSEIPLELPATLKNVKKDSVADTQKVIQNEKYKVLVINEPYDIFVDGKVMFYSDNAVLVDDNKVQSATEGTTVVVFKP